jgi:hypothetical protein
MFSWMGRIIDLAIRTTSVFYPPFTSANAIATAPCACGTMPFSQSPWIPASLTLFSESMVSVSTIPGAATGVLA